MARKRILLSTRSTVIVLLVIIFLHFTSLSAAESEADVLIKFKDSLKNNGALSNWDNRKPPCNGDHENWVGIFCEEGFVWGLQLQNMGLSGPIDLDSLAKLTHLRTMSFMYNNFDGPLPDLALLTGLKTVYLSHNKFSGEIPPETFAGMAGLKKLHLANNKFSGQIPTSLPDLPKLMELMLDNNEFEGEIPQFPPDRIKRFNVSHNKLVGEIPFAFSNFSASVFDGNADLCGAPLKSCTTPNKLSAGTIVPVSILVAATLVALVVVVVILHRRKQAPQGPEGAAAASASVTAPADKKALLELDKMEQGRAAPAATSRAVTPPSAPPEKTHQSKKSEPNVKITFLKEDRDKFDMSDLLRASAEVLGSGVFGSTYKAALGDGQQMVVKRFKHMNNVNREEFHEHMRRLGRLSHPNLLPIVGFYYRKEEKLLVADFVENGSLAVQLHGNRSRGRPCPNWATRLKIIKGVAKGLLYLCNELPSLTAPNGHLKSSNVLLDRSYNAVLTDYGLVPVVNQEHAQEHMICYKSPEYKQSGRITKKTDVWTLGILILEVLTGRFPSNFLQQGRSNDTDMAAWVESVIKDEASNVEVFDVNMERAKNCESEMMKLLKIGLECCQADIDSRPDIKEALEKIQEVKEEAS
ncbi:Pollen receptor-like kinase [Sesamum alatum]|uniref:Pollen receptor-like kinase n=1 Tax=Sesamum alatum TaxID=300844 RepID=A0AAE1XN45_9LAMI|nr:Pollen receptor-like kinase [Sesamum alatum]